MTAPPGLRLELLGGFRVIVDGVPAARAPGARQQQLLALLVLQGRSGPIPRQRVAGTIWPESTDVQALTNLRRELHHLRESWPLLDALVDAGTRTLAWRARPGVRVDVAAFEDAADSGLAGDRATLEEAARLYQGNLLPDVSDEWIAPDRERLRQCARRVLTRYVEVLERERSFGDAIDMARRLLRLDEVDEQAWCALLRCHAWRGERALALHLYQQCAAVLKRELGIAPGPAIRLTYREILDLDTTAAVTPPPPRPTEYPLVGRQLEWQTLLGAWEGAAAGHARLVVIRGEAGVGKSRLAEELFDWCGQQRVSAVSARCYAGEGRLAYAPISTWLKSDVLRPALMRLEPAWLSDIARLRPEILAARPEVPASDQQLENWQRLRFFEALARGLWAAAPLVLVLDDLQWADADTVDWLSYFLSSSRGSRCLIAATLRVEEEQDNPPLGRLFGRLEHDDLLTAIDLGPLDRDGTALLAAAVAGTALDDAALAEAFRETDGNPFFILERGRMGDADPAGQPAGRVPPQVQALVAARLDRLSEDARATAQLAAAVGRDFRFDLLAQAGDLEEDALVRALDELWRRHVVRVQADEEWDFSHDRIREVAYSGIGPARRRLLHRRIAQAMELLLTDRLDEASASIAAHLERGGQPARAIPFLERAAAVATRVSAGEEAIRCVSQALSLLERLPAGRERDERELALRSTLSVSLNSARGYAAPEVEHNLTRVLLLSSAAGSDRVPVRWLWVAFTLRFMLGDLKGTRDVAEQALDTSRSDPSCRCEAHHAMGGMLLSVGQLADARRHFEASLEAYDELHPQQSALGSDLGVFAHAWYSHALWLLGEEESALTHAATAVTLARGLDQKYSQTLAYAYAGLLHQMRRDIDRTRECADAALSLCQRHGFVYYDDWARVLLGWAQGQADPSGGVVAIESALAGLDAKRARARRPYYLSLLAETKARAGDAAGAAATLEIAIATALERVDVWWLPALYLQLSEARPLPERQVWLRRALDLARTQQSRNLERRILTVGGELPVHLDRTL